MNYEKVYNSLINKRRVNVLHKGHGIYIEKHHIIPRCMNGSNKSDNLINLTPKEHYIAHLLLYKIYENTNYKYNLLKAVLCMSEMKQSVRKIFSKSRIYEKIRIDYYSSSFIKKNGRKGYYEYIKNKTPDEILKIRNKALISRNKWFKSLTEEERFKIFKHCRTTFTGKKHTESTKEKMRRSSKNTIRIGKNNPITGKIWITNKETKENKLIDKTDNIPLGWFKGRSLEYTEEQLKKMSISSSERVIGTIGIYNPLTGEKRRIKNNMDIPNGFKRGFGPVKKNKS